MSQVLPSISTRWAAPSSRSPATLRADEIKAKLEQQFASLQGAALSRRQPPAPMSRRDCIRADRSERRAGHVVLGFGGIERSNPDYYKLQVMNHILGGGGLTSRLMKEVRSKEGPRVLSRERYSMREYFRAPSARCCRPKTRAPTKRDPKRPPADSPDAGTAGYRRRAQRYQEIPDRQLPAEVRHAWGKSTASCSRSSFMARPRLSRSLSETGRRRDQG